MNAAINLMLAAPQWLIAQEAGDGDGSSPLLGLLPLVLIGAAFYFFMIRPQRRRQRNTQQLRDSLDVGDEVRTVGGIYGRIRSLDDHDVVLDVGGGNTLRFARRAIAETVGDPTE